MLRYPVLELPPSGSKKLSSSVVTLQERHRGFIHFCGILWVYAWLLRWKCLELELWNWSWRRMEKPVCLMHWFCSPLLYLGVFCKLQYGPWIKLYVLRTTVPFSLEGELRRSLVQPPTQSRGCYEIRSGSSGLYLVWSWKPPVMETAWALWETCSTSWLSSWCKSFPLYPIRTSLISNFICCFLSSTVHHRAFANLKLLKAMLTAN